MSDRDQPQGRPFTMPGWTRRTNSKESLEEYRRMTADERAQVLVSVCEMATALLNARPDQHRLDWILNLQDSMPESSRRHFARLRRAHR